MGWSTWGLRSHVYGLQAYTHSGIPCTATSLRVIKVIRVLVIRVLVIRVLQHCV